VNVDILKNLTLIDSPGVLSGEKQTLGRSYSYDDVLNWFAERSDMIILLFDVQKLDISDEMGSAIKVLQKYVRAKRAQGRCPSAQEGGSISGRRGETRERSERKEGVAISGESGSSERNEGCVLLRRKRAESRVAGGRLALVLGRARSRMRSLGIQQPRPQC
jgi:hypothetical protein